MTAPNCKSIIQRTKAIQVNQKIGNTSQLHISQTNFEHAKFTFTSICLQGKKINLPAVDCNIPKAFKLVESLKILDSSRNYFEWIEFVWIHECDLNIMKFNSISNKESSLKIVLPFEIAPNLLFLSLFLSNVLRQKISKRRKHSKNLRWTCFSSIITNKQIIITNFCQALEPAIKHLFIKCLIKHKFHLINLSAPRHICKYLMCIA